MKKSLLSILAASAFFAAGGLAYAQTSTTTSSTTWTTDQGSTFREYSTSKKYEGYRDPAMTPSIGMALPDKVTIYPLPETMKVPSSENYSYGMINDRPVVVERSSRKVVHTWD